MTDNFPLYLKIEKEIDKAATTLARLTSRIWTNPKLTVKKKVDNVKRPHYQLATRYTLARHRLHMPDTWEDSARNSYPESKNKRTGLNKYSKLPF